MMTPTRPYFLRAVYEWILDNDCTPFLAVNALSPGVQVPDEYVEDGQITLNLSPSAIVNLQMGNERIEFSARFSGVSRLVVVPMSAVLGIFAKENGQGMAFPDEPGLDEDIDSENDETTPPDDDPEPPRPSGPPNLKVVK